MWVRRKKQNLRVDILLIFLQTILSIEPATFSLYAKLNMNIDLFFSVTKYATNSYKIKYMCVYESDDCDWYVLKEKDAFL